MAITAAHAKLEDSHGFYCKGANHVDADGKYAAMLGVEEKDEVLELEWFHNLETFEAGRQALEHMA